MADLVSTFFDWLPLIALVAFVVFFVRPIHLVSYMVRRALKKGDDEKAMAIATRYARLRPKDPKAWLIWAWLADRQGVRWGTAGLLREGFDRNPGSLDLGVELAWALIKNGKNGEAYELLQEIRDRHPSAPEPIVLMARLAAMAENGPEARRLIAKAREFIEPKKHSRQGLDLAYLLLLLRERDEAEEVLQVVEEHLYEAEPHLFLALLKEKSDPVQARRHLAAARYYWQGPRTEIAEALEQARELVG